MNKCKNCQAVLPDRLPGQLGRNKLFCNRFCWRLFRNDLKNVIKPEFCHWCGIALNQDNKRGNPKRYCSRQHAGFYRQANKPKVSKVKIICVFCSKAYITNRKTSRFCSSDCRSKQIAIETRAVRAANGSRVYSAECERCSQIISEDKKRYGRFCRNCALVRQRERYRQSHLRRQQVLNPLRISVEVLIERDGVVCHLCGVDVDLALPRNSRFGATIDHVVPLSKGGLDVLDNLKLAHWICNIKKGNRVDA